MPKQIGISPSDFLSVFFWGGWVVAGWMDGWMDGMRATLDRLWPVRSAERVPELTVSLQGWWVVHPFVPAACEFGDWRLTAHCFSLVLDPPATAALPRRRLPARLTTTTNKRTRSRNRRPIRYSPFARRGRHEPSSSGWTRGGDSVGSGYCTRSLEAAHGPMRGFKWTSCFRKRIRQVDKLERIDTSR
jgi:hypothetical protein